jgi:acyl-coenzyme A synthetase/AMP-(fatty) acid ligase
VPAHLRALRLLDPGQLPELARVFSSAAPLPPDTAKMLHARFGLAVTEVLGSTETGGIASRVSGPEIVHADDAAMPARVWTPLPHVEVGVEGGADGNGRLIVNSPFLPPEGPRPWPTADRVDFSAPRGPPSATSGASTASSRSAASASRSRRSSDACTRSPE